MLVDTHCHVDAYPDPIGILNQAESAGVQVIAVTNSPGDYRLLRTRLGRRAGVEVALGFHPLRAGQATAHDLARFFRFLPQARWIGEIGLDFSRAGLGTRREQLRLFDAILADRRLGTKPVTVHSRGAERETVTRLCQANANAILHWYTGPLGVVDEALAGGLSFSINPAMIRSARSELLLRQLPPGAVLLETDGPYSRYGGRPASPTDILRTIQALSRVWGTTDDEAVSIIQSNQGRFFPRNENTSIPSVI